MFLLEVRMGLYTGWLMSTGISSRILSALTWAAGGGEAGAKRLYEMTEKELSRIAGPKVRQALWKAREKSPEEVADHLRAAGISFVFCEEPEFPARLYDIPNPPFGIYFKGRLPDKKPTLAIIGTRAASPYGIESARKFAEGLSKAGVQVVSGMARGIDGVAGRAALNGSGGSFAVLGSGVDVCYPRDNEDLYLSLLNSGGVLSEYPPGASPERRHFPARNRIIAGLADAVLVIEAQEKSGTLITVDAALEQGKEVFALPGRICDRNSYACNQLLRQGAIPATCVEDVLEHFFGLRDHQMDLSELFSCIDIEETPKARESVSKETMRCRAGVPVEHTPDFDAADFTPLMAKTLTLLDPVKGQRAGDLLPGLLAEGDGTLTLKDLTRALTYLAIAGYAGELSEGVYIRTCGLPEEGFSG